MSQGLDVGRRTARAAVWGFAATATAKGVTLLGLLLLARILAPREFGLLAFAMAYITYAETIGDLGSGVALVYWPDRRDEAAQVTFLVNAVAGIFWCLLTIALAPFIAQFFKTPAGAPIVRMLALSFPIKFLGTAHDALAQKDLRFRARALPDFAFAFVKAGSAIALALLGYGAWSLIYGHLAGLAVSTILLWVIVPWRPSWTFPRDLFKPMLAYGRNIMVVNVLHGVVSDSDLAFVGHYLGVTTLGLYQMGTRITETGVSMVLRVIGKVLFPAFAELHGAGERLRRPFLFATRYVPAITFPASIGIAVLARPIVLASLGKQWTAAVPILAMLGVYMGFNTLGAHGGDVLKATGRAQILARWSALKAVMVLIALFIASHYNAVAVAGALLIVSVITSAILLAMASRYVEAKLSETLMAFVPSFTASMVMAAAVYFWLRLVAHWSAWPQLITGCAIGGAVYLLTLRVLDPEIFVWAAKNLRPGRAGQTELPA